jgi:hypothetical protein
LQFWVVGDNVLEESPFLFSVQIYLPFLKVHIKGVISVFQLGNSTNFEYMSRWLETFQLSAIDREMAWFRFVADAAPIGWTILMAVSSFFAVTTNKVVICIGR